MPALKYWDGSAWQYVNAVSAVEYAMRLQQGVSTSCPSATWTLLPLTVTAVPAEESASARDCFRPNTDGTLTVLKSGWYSVSGMAICGAPAPAASLGIQFGIAVGASDAIVPSSGAGLRGEAPMSTGGGTPVWQAAGVQYIAANSRVGLLLFNRDSTARAFTALWLSIARVGAGPKGDKGDQGIQGPLPNGKTMNMGVTTVSLPAFAATSMAASVSGPIAHGLGVTPSGIQAQVYPGAGDRLPGVPIGNIESRDATNFTCRHHNASQPVIAIGAGTVTIAWMAWV